MNNTTLKKDAICEEYIRAIKQYRDFLEKKQQLRALGSILLEKKQCVFELSDDKGDIFIESKTITSLVPKKDIPEALISKFTVQKDRLQILGLMDYDLSEFFENEDDFECEIEIPQGKNPADIYVLLTTEIEELDRSKSIFQGTKYRMINMLKKEPDHMYTYYSGEMVVPFELKNVRQNIFDKNSFFKAIARGEVDKKFITKREYAHVNIALFE